MADKIAQSRRSLSPPSLSAPSFLLGLWGLAVLEVPFSLRIAFLLTLRIPLPLPSSVITLLDRRFIEANENTPLGGFKPLFLSFSSRLPGLPAAFFSRLSLSSYSYLLFGKPSLLSQSARFFSPL